MTLLWATDVIDREIKRQQDQALRMESMDPALEIRQACRELDELFHIRNRRSSSRGGSFVSRGGLSGRRKGRVMQKWGLAFKHDDY